MWVFYSALQGVLDLARVCPHCRNKQLVKMRFRGETVACKKCGRDIPPPKQHNRR